MKAVRVQYTVRPEFVEQNKKNIAAVMDRLKANPIEGMYYSSSILADGNSFMHVNMAKDQETMNKLTEVEEFSQFRMALKASGLLSPPKSEDMEFVGANWEI
jgi:hypothetical protein